MLNQKKVVADATENEIANDTANDNDTVTGGGTTNVTDAGDLNDTDDDNDDDTYIEIDTETDAGMSNDVVTDDGTKTAGNTAGNIANDTRYLRCPLTKQIMNYPVYASDGHTYESEAIKEYLYKHGTSPLTGEKLVNTVWADHKTKDRIQDYLTEHPECKLSNDFYLSGALKRLFVRVLFVAAIDELTQCVANDIRVLTCSLISNTQEMALHLAIGSCQPQIATSWVLDQLTVRYPNRLQELLNAKDGAGHTPLHLAVIHNPILIPYLLAQNVATDIKDAGSATPMDVAINLGDKMAIAILKLHQLASEINQRLQAKGSISKSEQGVLTVLRQQNKFIMHLVIECLELRTALNSTKETLNTFNATLDGWAKEMQPANRFFATNKALEFSIQNSGKQLNPKSGRPERTSYSFKHRVNSATTEYRACIKMFVAGAPQRAKKQFINANLR